MQWKQLGFGVPKISKAIWGMDTSLVLYAEVG